MTKNEEASYGSIPTAEPVEAVPMVEVTAPATMLEGYKFRAVYEGVQFPVIVPAGGCTKDQVLTVPFNPNANALPTRGWKDDIFECTKYGIIHPSLLTACCCPLILMGQIMTRLKLDWLAKDAPEAWKGTFRRMIYITIGYFILNMILSPVDPQDPCSPMFNVVVFIYTLFMIYLMAVVRRRIRQRDQIPEERCIGCEDVVCAAFCGCCTVSQMARQTADYDLDEGRFFTSDGLPLESVPAPVMHV
jgi:Cys-rich protein (TIGR01571 family)